MAGFWARVFGQQPTVPNANGPLTHNPGDPDGFQYNELPTSTETRSGLPPATAWDGWPNGWQTPTWNSSFADGSQNLLDIAWQCLDLNSNIVSAMPVYQTRDTRIIEPERWMANPDPDIYTSWGEFMKQFFWDFQMGEVFVLPFATSVSTGKPTRFRVIPPPFVTVDMVAGKRTYKIGEKPVTDEILHIRYKSETTSPRGRGPLEVAGAKQTQIKLLQRYGNQLAEQGGVPLYWIGVQRHLTKSEGDDLLESWIEQRAKRAGQPAILGSNATLNQARTMDAKEMGLLEISQFSESRIAGLLGVPPFLVGLAGASGSLTYSNISDLFDYHDRSSLRPKTKMLMEGLSTWALPQGRGCEVNRDDYTRLPFDQRMQAYAKAIEMEILTPEEVRIMERFYGAPAAQALSGGID